MKKDEKPNTLALLTITTFMTHIHTHGHGDSMTDPAQRAELVKSVDK